MELCFSGFGFVFFSKVFSGKDIIIMGIKRLTISEKEYRAIHNWLTKNYGKPNSCCNLLCSHKSGTFQWAIKKGYDHARDISRYVNLCSSCHLMYDFDNERKEKMRKSMIGKNSKLNEWQKRVLKKSFQYGATLKDLGVVFNLSYVATHNNKGGSRLETPNYYRKYNDKQISIMRHAYRYGSNASDLSRIFNGTDIDRGTIHKIVNYKAYV